MPTTKSTKRTLKSESRKTSIEGKTAKGKNFAGLSLKEREKKAREISDSESNNKELLCTYKKLHTELKVLNNKFEKRRNHIKNKSKEEEKKIEQDFKKEFEQKFNNVKEEFGIDDKQAKAVKEQVYWKTWDSCYKYQKPESFKGDLPNAKIIFVNINPGITNEWKEPNVPTDKTSDEDTYNYFKNGFKDYNRDGKVPSALQGAIKITDAIAKGEGRSGIMEGKEDRGGCKYQAEDVRALNENNVAIIDVSPIRSDKPKNVKEYLNDGAGVIIEKLKASNAETVILTGKSAKKYKDDIEKATEGKVKVLESKKHISYIDSRTCNDLRKKIQNLKKE